MDLTRPIETAAGPVTVLGQMCLYGTDVLIGTTTYRDGNLAVVAVEPSGEIFGRISINLPGELGPTEFAVSHDLPERAAEHLLYAGPFEDTGRKVTTGFVDLLVYQLKGQPSKPHPKATKSTDMAYELLIDGHTTTPVIYKEGCYICEDPEFAQMGLPLCRKCEKCGGHIAADNCVCDDCGAMDWEEE